MLRDLIESKAGLFFVLKFLMKSRLLRSLKEFSIDCHHPETGRLSSLKLKWPILGSREYRGELQIGVASGTDYREEPPEDQQWIESCTGGILRM